MNRKIQTYLGLFTDVMLIGTCVVLLMLAFSFSSQKKTAKSFFTVSGNPANGIVIEGTR